ncbi:MAG: DNA-protecting protein DprA [Phormidesmis sp. RL_2_1]|nr:DNA-protecting protein DprA [Phormidesmis sp. RL_2_1]
MATERAYWLAWSRIKDVGPVTIKRLWEHFGALATAWQAPANALLSVDGIGLLIAEKIVSQRPKLDPEKLLVQHEAENQSFWTPADPDYPALLFAINDPPPLLYYRGHLRLNSLTHASAGGPLTVGIVGTRRPSMYGRRWTQRLSSTLARKGAIIISGLAAGIDTEAHTSCLRQDGLTVAVLGTGVDVVYPQRNQGLYGQIAQHGLILSEYPDGTAPDKTHFPRRNRIIAGLSRALLVTEAPARSGALITARLANDYCREVYALPCALDNSQGEGCLRLINEGAQMILGEQMLAIALEALPPDAVTTLPQQSNPLVGSSPSELPDLTATMPELSPLLTQVLNAVTLEPAVLDQIVQAAQVDTGSVLGALVELELSGLVIQLPGMQYQRA